MINAFAVLPNGSHATTRSRKMTLARATRLLCLRLSRTLRRASEMANWDVTKLDVFKYLRCLRHLGKAMLLVVFALAWLEVQAVFSCSLAPAWRQGGLIMRALVGITGAVFLAMVSLPAWQGLSGVPDGYRAWPLPSLDAFGATD